MTAYHDEHENEYDIRAKSGTLDTKALEAAARAVYAVLPNFGMEWQPNTAGGRSKVRVDDPWEDAPDRHEDCTRQAQAAIEAYLSQAPTPSRNDILEAPKVRAADVALAFKDAGLLSRDGTFAQGPVRDFVTAFRALVKP